MLVLLAAGCGGGILSDKIADYDSLIESGWEKYNQRKYDAAYQLFLSAKRQDALRPEAYIGSGWTLLRRQQPDSSVVAFRTSFDYITTTADSVDSITGLSGAYLAAGENTKVVDMFKKYIVGTYEDSFPLKKHDFFLDENDLEIVQSMACYRLGLYSSTQKADPDNAVYHLNKVLVSPITYSDPKTLMQAILDYLDTVSGDSTL